MLIGCYFRPPLPHALLRECHNKRSRHGLPRPTSSLHSCTNILRCCHRISTVDSDSGKQRRLLLLLALIDPQIVQENCWFFVSIIQEALLKNFGGRYESGSLNHPALGGEHRKYILTKIGDLGVRSPNL